MDPTSTRPSTTTPKQTQPRVHSWLLPLTGVLVAIAAAVGGWMWWTHYNNQVAEETPSAMVNITDSGFSPVTITIKKGQDVTWTNQGRAAYQLVPDQNKPQGFKTTSALNPGDSYSFTFEESGTYPYHDPANIDRKGVIVVE